jgi:hypothetical protein
MKDPFDFNGDGKVDPTEEYLGYKIYEDNKKSHKAKPKQSDNEYAGNIIGIIILLIVLFSCGA